MMMMDLIACFKLFNPLKKPLSHYCCCHFVGGETDAQNH